MQNELSEINRNQDRIGAISATFTIIARLNKWDFPACKRVKFRVGYIFPQKQVWLRAGKHNHHLAALFLLTWETAVVLCAEWMSTPPPRASSEL